ncbi:MAG: hypothetical protein MI862_25275 [Desulfobacterales bacterium]|nr:hypothetical protein [Desulfobacterales bacterium]
MNISSAFKRLSVEKAVKRISSRLFQPRSTIKFFLACEPWVFTPSLATGKVPDARRQGVTSEAYHSYSAGRNDRRQRSRRYLDGGSGSNEGVIYLVNSL